METYLPEGQRLHTPENNEALCSLPALSEAMRRGTILEAPVLHCDAAHNLSVDLGYGRIGFIPREEAALGIKEGTTRDIAIVSRVGLPVCFVVTAVAENGSVTLSRVAAQERCLAHLLTHLRPGDIIDGRVTRNEPFGTFLDIGCGICSFISIENISVSRISHPNERFCVGDPIRAVVSRVDRENHRIILSHKELLGSWEENAALFQPGETVPGIVRSMEDYGVFIELAPNLTGLAEKTGDIQPGQHVSVYIKSINPQKMKVKLVIIGAIPAPVRSALHYFQTGRHLERWVYTPACCEKRMIETIFTD